MTPFNVLQHAVRAKEVLGVLARPGFADLLGQIDLPAGFWQRWLPHPPERRSTGERVRRAAEAAGAGTAWLTEVVAAFGGRRRC